MSDGRTVDAAVRRIWARSVAAAAALATVFGLVPTAMAEGDAGEHTFFQDQVRLMQASPAAQQPARRSVATAPPATRRSAPRHLASVPSRREPVRIAPRPAAAVPVVASAGLAPLTIHPTARPVPKVGVAAVLEDRTLRRGDVVIMAQGPRVFAGSRQFPYVEQDFVAVRSIPGVTKEFRRDLDAIANNPYQHI